MTALRFLRRNALKRKTKDTRSAGVLTRTWALYGVFLVVLAVALGFLFRFVSTLRDQEKTLRDAVPVLNREALEAVAERARKTPSPPPPIPTAVPPPETSSPESPGGALPEPL